MKVIWREAPGKNGLITIVRPTRIRAKTGDCICVFEQKKKKVQIVFYVIKDAMCCEALEIPLV